MTETQKFEVGDMIENRYRVLLVIGTGGMGTLYRVSDEVYQNKAVYQNGGRGGENVALKTVRLNVPAAEAPERVERFQREFQLLTQLHHPNLVSVYDYGVTTEEELYFTMEWIEGQNLESRLLQLDPADTILVIVQICRALAYLHARGVIHGDLKPPNVLMTGESVDQVKIVDFGVALETRSPETRARFYTPGYSTPEIRYQRPVDHRADLYSLGALWYTLLLKEAPLFLPGTERLIPFMLREALQAQEQIPVEIGDVITRLMSADPEDRYASANQVIQVINQVMGSAYELETRDTASSYALRTHFVGREAEIQILETMWEQAQSGKGKLVLVSGESGVGKTRLVEEFEINVTLEGARVVRGQCLERGGSAYHPWREVLRVLVRYIEGVDEKVLRQVGPVLALLLSEMWERGYMAGRARPAELEPQAAQLRLNDTIVQILRAAASLRPTVIVIEDAHWADEATLELLHFLSRIPSQEKLLVCVTYSSEEIDPDHPLTSFTKDQVQRIPVQRLSPEFTSDLTCSMLGLKELPTMLAEQVQQTTGGNAFFVQELIRSLATEEKVLRRTVEGWEVDREALREARLPESIRQVTWRRLEHLTVEARQVLQWAAAVGFIFWDGSVAEVGRMTRAQVRAALREGVEQGLVMERDGTVFVWEREYLFNSPTVREVSYERILQEERRGIHARIAAWLMARIDEGVNEHLGLIAEHLEQAGQVAQAVIYLRQAGEQAAAQFANVEAIAYLNRALDLLAEDERSERYALLLSREALYGLQGARDAQEQDLIALQELSELLDDAQSDAAESRRAEVALRQTVYAAEIGDYPAAIAAARKAVEFARLAGDTSHEAEGYSRWGTTLWQQGEYQAAQRQIEQALALAQKIEDRRVEANSLRGLGIVFDLQGDPVTSSKCSEQALDIYREIGDRSSQGSVLNNLGVNTVRQGDYASTIVRWEQALQIARETGHRLLEGLVVGNLGEVSITLGTYDQSQQYLEQALQTTREIGDREGHGRVLSSLGMLFYEMGDDEATMDYIQQGLLIMREIGDRRMEASTLTRLGRILTRLERLAEAAETYQQSLDIRRELGQHHIIAESLSGLATVALLQGNLDQARSHIDEVLAHFEELPQRSASEPLVTHLNCYHVLRAVQDPRARTVLDTTYHLLQEQAAKITDDEMRRSFLENVDVHREIVREFAEASATPRRNV
ncbi:MAG: tetratricopeptide repeat protein [Chloroflexi bacterium]|nr:tetratricopeptide repeat protein [Chloroflexota bacterium]